MKASYENRFRRIVVTWVAAATICLVGAVCSQAQQFTLNGTSAELVARGINADFEQPVLAATDAETFSTSDLGLGWTFHQRSGVSSNYGVQNPAVGFFGSANPLPSAFDGSQIGFVNLDPFSIGEVISDPIGRLRANQNYMLRVAVGSRATDGQADLAYRVGLRASDGTDLGSFATVTTHPSVANTTNIVDLQYTLNSATVAAYVGDPVSIVIGGFNTGMRGEDLAVMFSQANFDNVRLSGTFDTVLDVDATLTVNRATGNLSLANTGDANMSVVGYSLTSDAGAFNRTAWNRLNANWTATPGSPFDLTEVELSLGGGPAVTISPGNPFNLGNSWLKTPYEDIQGEVQLEDGTVLPLNIVYTNSSIAEGDLNGDGNINATDWALFKGGQGQNRSGLSIAQSYGSGDLNGDLVHNLTDFNRFRNAYLTANPGGAAAFAAMVRGVPEPGTGLLLACGCLVGWVGFRRQREHRGVCSMNCISQKLLGLLAGVVFCISGATPGFAQDLELVAHWSFDQPTLTVSGSNITMIGDATGNHHASPGIGGSGGATGMDHVSGPFPTATSSVSGRFGEAIQFAGDNFLLFDNLTELMESAGAPNYSISMWVNTTTTPGGGTPFMTLSNWGNEPASAGATRFTYAFGPQAASAMRGQSRHFNDASVSGTDIFATNNATSGPVNDGNWHMLTWTFDTTTGVLNRYYDGEFQSAFTSTAASFAMADSSSAVGGMGLKGDDGQMLPAEFKLDEVYVLKGILSDEQVMDLYNTNSVVVPSLLTLRVDPMNGQVQLRNDSEEAISFNGYQITSNDPASLNSGGWTPISSQTIAGFPVGDGSGNGWEAGPSPSSSELVEWYLTGDSTLDPGGVIGLGPAYNTSVDAQNVALRFNRSDNVLLNGMIEYAAIEPPDDILGDFNSDGVVDAADYTVWRDTGGSTAQFNQWKSNFGATGGSGAALAQAAVPEPAAAALLLLAIASVLLVASRRRCECHASWALAAVRTDHGLALLLALVVCQLAAADVTPDRRYQFGEEGDEGGTANEPVGTGNGFGSTFDSVSPFNDLFQPAGTGSTQNPTYEDLTSLGRSGLGVRFNNANQQWLSGRALGFPALAASTPHHPERPGPNNYDGVFTRGFQLWVYPESGVATSQDIVADTTQHGARINAAGQWEMAYAGMNVNSGVAAPLNQWSHVMVAMPAISNPMLSVMYVDGVAVAARQANYTRTAVINAQTLSVGANSGAEGVAGTANYFRGVIDELQLFVWGEAYDPETDMFLDYGTFLFSEDNDFADDFLIGPFGDITNTGSVTQADVNAFVAGWRTEKLVNGIRVGDLETYAAGDLNFDGIVNFADAALMRGVIAGLGSATALDLSAFNALGIPEPSSALLALAAAGAGVYLRKRQRTSCHTFLINP